MKTYPLIITFLFVSLSLKAQKPTDTTNKTPTQTTKTTEKIISPVFPGGFAGWTHFINFYLRYPDKAQSENIQGRVILQFIVELNGTLSDIKVISSPSVDLSNEALRVMTYSPKWKPAIQNGIPVRAFYKAPINFTLTQPPKTH